MNKVISSGLLALSITYLGCIEERQSKKVSNPDPRDAPEAGFYVSSATQSAERASVLPTTGSEDVSDLLGTISIPLANGEASKDYLPNPTVQWVVTVSIDQVLTAKEVIDHFGKAWRAKHGDFTIFGRDTATGHWTYLVCADCPDKVDSLLFAWDYFPFWSDDAVLYRPAVYDARLKAVAAGVGNLARCTVTANVNPIEASKRAEMLSSLRERLDRSISIRLVAPSGKQFVGREIWDVMLCLGLRWGDMDCFHWNNSHTVGDDSFFSVWTSTTPGYFLPEEVAAGRVNVEDLVFGYSIPRSADPVTVFDRMLAATRYAQKRLGGTLRAEDGSPLDLEATRNEIHSIAEELTSLGFSPGSDNALQQF